MPAKQGNKVTVTLPDYLHQWLSDTADQQFRSVQQQIVFLLARAFDGHTPSEEAQPSVPAVIEPVARTEPATRQPAERGVPVNLDSAARFPVLAQPPDGTVTHIKVYGIDPTIVESAAGKAQMGATLSVNGNGPLYAIDPDLWIEPVQTKFAQMYGKRLSVKGQNGGVLYLT